MDEVIPNTHKKKKKKKRKEKKKKKKKKKPFSSMWMIFSLIKQKVYELYLLIYCS